jgi:hypothetical protein
MKKAESVYDSAFQAVDKTLHDAKSDVENAWHHIRATAASVGHILAHDIPDAFHRAEDDARGLYNDAEHDLRSVESKADAWYHDALNAVSAAVKFVQDKMIDPIWDEIHKVVGSIGHEIDAWWNGVYKVTIAPIVSIAEAAFHEADAVYHWFVNTAESIVAVCVQAEGWLLWFAANPMAGWQEIIADAIHSFSVGEIVQLAQSGDQYVDSILSDFAAML